MKRFFFTVIALAAVAVSCTKSGVLESPQTYQDQITFEPYTGKAPVTKATVADDATLRGGFRVIGFNAASDGVSIADPAATPYLSKMVTGTLVDVKDAEGKPVLNEDGTQKKETKWSYTGAMFWPDKAADKLCFAAYGLNVNGTPSVNTTTGDVTLNSGDIFKQNGNYATFQYTVPPARAAQKDLLISPLNTGDNGRTVAMRLYHVLSKIGFSVDIQNATTTKPEVEITAIELTGNFIETATFNLAEAVTVTENVASYKVGGTATEGKTYYFYGTDEITFKSSTTGKQTIHTGNENDRFMMIVPGQGKEIIVEYKIDGKEQKPARLDLSSLTFDAGKAYEFVFTLSTVAVGFDVDVTPWGTDHTDASKDYPLN